MPLPCPRYPEKCETAQKCHRLIEDCLFNTNLDNPDRKKNRRRCCVTEGIQNPNEEKDIE